ncbi:hypothetical protein [Saccharothrix obliqua]|uniref:hypothetical protein n=1 Tax=Saccharothrix obliqua TaxID=2861747 RepID=UPI001C5E6F1D|nr:hypothetical protein [Saccharothrix obliqua]MBW4716158.1 hypothetical protein [Saccharothrix obliqua]
MTNTAGPPPMCGSCGAYLQPPNTTCPVCGTNQWPQQPPVYIPHAPPAPEAAQPYGVQPPVAQPPGAYPPGAYPPGVAQPYGVPVRGIVTAKSSGVAVLLSLLWLGAGNLYAGQTALGVVLIIVNFPLWLLALTILGWFIAFPIWVILVVVATIFAAQGTREFNLRNGIMVQ